MLFSEIYGIYFHTAAAILAEAVKGELTEEKLTELVREKAFAESLALIPAALKEEWSLLDDSLRTPLKNPPFKPLTLLEKRWLRTLLDDPRIALFEPDAEGLADVKPLFSRERIVFFDQYADGDPYEDPGYISNFRIVLKAFREHRKLRVSFTGHLGKDHCWICVPYWLEYSEKDDKFRLITASRSGSRMTVNLARIRRCELLEPYSAAEYLPPPPKPQPLVMELIDERNGLERIMLHFSHLQKETVKLSENRYRLTLYYDKEDETEILIRVLSFGSLLRVLSPPEFIAQIKTRLEKQQALFKKE